jgi:oligopeptide transport system substrate-binding protein
MRGRVCLTRLAQLTVALLLALTACSAPTPVEPTSTSAPPAIATVGTANTPVATMQAPTAAPLLTPATVATPAAAPASPTPLPDTEIRIASAEPANMDPGTTSDTVAVGIVMQLFEGLVAKDQQGDIVPRVAERWETSSDGLTYTFHLREGPKWSDGRPVVAGDFEWTWKRNSDPRTDGDYVANLLPIKNAERIANGEIGSDQLGVVAPDDRTLVVTLERPAAHFLTLVSSWTLLPLRRDTVEQNGDRWVEADHILTNGPYRLDEWTHDQRIVLVADPNYWGTSPQVRRVVFTIFPDGGEDQALAAYEAGDLDTLGTTVPIPIHQVDRVKSDKNYGYLTYDVSGTYFLVVNARQEHLRDPRVRKALGMALERDKLIDDVLNEPAEPAFSLQPPGIAGRDPSLWPKEDEDDARDLLKEAGYPDGKGLPVLSYAYNADAGHRRIAEYLQERWRSALGVELRLTTMDWRVFLQWRATEDWIVGGDLFRGGWFSDYEDPDDWYSALWFGGTDPIVFNSGWRNERYDELVAQASSELNATARTRLYAQAEQILADEFPSIPLYHYRGHTLVRSYVKGMLPSRMLGVLPLSSMTVEPH